LSQIPDTLEIGFNVHVGSLRRGQSHLHRQFFLHPPTRRVQFGLGGEVENEFF
jgi:hypothetical protein